MLCVVVLVVETRSTQGLDENDESMLGGEWALLFNHNGKLVPTLTWYQASRAFDFPEFTRENEEFGNTLHGPLIEMQQLDAFVAFLVPGLEQVQAEEEDGDHVRPSPKRPRFEEELAVEVAPVVRASSTPANVVKKMFQHPLFERNLLDEVRQYLGVCANPDLCKAPADRMPSEEWALDPVPLDIDW